MAEVIEQVGFVPSDIVGKWWTRHRVCPICDPAIYTMCSKPLYRVPADPPLAECDVVTCSGCGFAFSDTPTTQAEFDRYYAASTKYGPEMTGPSGWNCGRYAEAARRFRDLGISGEILDIGGGQGGLATIADRHGFRNVRTVNKPLHTIEVAERQDCVTLCHVLEHVRDLDPAMRNLYAIAETVYAEVPDAARYHEFCDSPYQQFNAEHLQHFTAEYLRRLFWRYGFAQVASGRGACGDPPPHLSPYVWGFFERAKPAADAVRAYCDKSASLWQKIMAKFLPPRFIAWGIGQLARKLEPFFSGRVVMAIDSHNVDGVYCGEEIILPKCAGDWNAIDNSESILVTTIQHRESVLEDIAWLGLKNEVVTLP